MDILGKLFGSQGRVKVMRVFLLNPGVALGSREVAGRAKISSAGVTAELNRLKAAGLIIKRVKGKHKVWQLNPSFPYLEPLRSMLKSDLAGQRKTLIRDFSLCGKLKLLVLAGVFIGQNDSRADILLVGNNLKRPNVERIIRSLETEVGREINYAMLNADDFADRLDSGDRFIRDVLDYPHDVVIDKLGLSTV